MVPLQCWSHPEPLRKLSLRMGSLRHLSFKTDFTSDPVRVRIAWLERAPLRLPRGHCGPSWIRRGRRPGKASPEIERVHRQRDRIAALSPTDFEHVEVAANHANP